VDNPSLTQVYVFLVVMAAVPVLVLASGFVLIRDVERLSNRRIIIYSAIVASAFTLLAAMLSSLIIHRLDAVLAIALGVGVWCFAWEVVSTLVYRKTLLWFRSKRR
jgi:cytochrome b subunit of formate dehydrogenase